MVVVSSLWRLIQSFARFQIASVRDRITSYPTGMEPECGASRPMRVNHIRQNYAQLSGECATSDRTRLITVFICWIMYVHAADDFVWNENAKYIARKWFHICFIRITFCVTLFKPIPYIGIEPIKFYSRIINTNYQWLPL